MAELTLPRMDFAPLGQLGAVYKQNQNERKLSDLGKMLADGSIDYRAAAGQVADMGDINSTLKFLALAEQEKQKKLELQAGTDFNKSVGGMFGGGQPAAPAARSASVGVPSLQELGPNAAPPRAPVPSTPKVWGDAEAEAAGLYEPAKRTAVAPQPIAPAAPRIDGPTAEHVPALVSALSNPNLPSGQKETAKLLLTEAFKNMKEPEKIQTLRALQANPQLLEIEKQLKASTNINIDQKGEGEFEKEFSKGQAKRWNGYIEGGQAAERALVDINSMREISQRMGSQGAAANVKETIGPYAEALGINIEGLSDVQAYSSIIQRLAPQQRAEGSGSTSDIEFKGFLKSLPTLTQHPAAREVGLNTMEALARDSLERGAIATKLATKEITRTEAEKQLRALPDPMQSFVEWRKSNPGVYGQALKGQASPSQGAAKQVPFTKVEIDQSLANARAKIAENPAARDFVIKKLRDNGLDTSGL